MSMAGLDIDAILRAQSSDGEEDNEAAEGNEVLDAEAFDRRLEEILNADEEDEEDDDDEGKSLPANPPVSHRSERSLDSFNTLSLHSPEEDAGALVSSSHQSTSTSIRDAMVSESSSRLRTSSKDQSLLQDGALDNSLYPTSSKDVVVESSLHSSTFVEYGRVSASSPLFTGANVGATSVQGSLQSRTHSKYETLSPPSMDSRVSDKMLKFHSPNRNARVLGTHDDVILDDSSQLLKDRGVSQSSNVYRASIDREDFSSMLLPMSASQASTTPSRQPGPFSSDTLQFGANYGTSVGQHTNLSSYLKSSGRELAAARPGAALTAAAAASMQALGNSTVLFQDELSTDEVSSTRDDSAGSALLSTQADQNVEQVDDESDVCDKADHLGKAEGRIGGDDYHTQSLHMNTMCPNDMKNQSDSLEREDDALVLEHGMDVFINADDVDDDDDDDDDDNDDAFDMESPLATAISSEDDSDEEEMQSILSNESMASDFRALPSVEKDISQNASSRLTKSKGNLTELKYSALDTAEEAEKKAASSGLHIAEGAASQPMRLKGMQTGPPSIGYLKLETVNSVSQILSVSSMVRDHGTGQAVAIHGNHLAVGLSKGSVLLLPMKSSKAKSGDAIDTKPLFLSSADKSHASVTSLSFNMQGDLLLVGYANGFLALWELSSKGGSSKPASVEHNAAILHTAFFFTKHQKAISADCKGHVLLHSISWGTFGRYSITTLCLVDGQNTGMVLCLSPVLVDVGFENSGNSNVLQSSTTAAASTALTSMVGGMVRGVVAGKSSDLGKRSINEGGIADETGNMVVFVTHQAIIVLRLPPNLKKCATLARPDGIRDGGIPYIAWRSLRMNSGISARGSGSSRNQGSQADPIVEVNQQSDEENEKEDHPLLVLGWDKKVFILQLLKDEMKILVSWDLDSIICGVTWLDEQIVAIVTFKEQVCLFTKEGLEVQRVAIESDEENESLELSYHTHMLNTFGNPEKTYYSSLAVRAATMYLLGPQRIYRAQLLPWQDQLRALQDGGDWMGAFHVGMELFDGRSLAVMSLPKGIDLLRKTVTPTLLDLLSAYIDEVFTYLALAFGTTTDAIDTAVDQEELKAQAKDQYARVGGVAIEFCVHLHQTDVLFDHIFHKFCAAGQRGTFLELLEPYILKDTLGALAPEVMQGLVEHYSQMGWLQRVEHCVLHMDIASLDFNQVVRLCRENGLYSALIYLFNKGLDDFKSPLEELLIVVQDVSKPNVRACGYKLLIYMKYCFLGLAFPPGHGEIPASRLPVLRSELLQCLLDTKPLTPPQTAKKLLDFQTIIHPRLSCLLVFDLLATLKVLQYAFPENGPLGIGDECLNQRLPLTNTEELDLIDEAKDGLQLLQDIVGALTDILESIHLYTMDGSKPHVEVDAWNLHMSKIDAGYVMEFIAEYVASGRAKVPRVVLARILEYLASADRKAKKVDDARRKEGILVKLLNGVPESEWDPFHILELALQAHFWQASACLLAKKGDYVAALDSYMKDKEQPYNGFLFVLDLLNPQKELSKEIISEFRGSVLARLPQLLQLSSEATLVVMLKHFSKEHRTILSDLAPYPPLLFQYLKQIMNARLGYKSGSLAAQNVRQSSEESTHTIAHDPGHKFSDFLIGDESLADLLKIAGLEFSNETEELYVELLCKFEPKSVLKFLKSFEDYRLEHCLKLCQDYNITDGAAYLLERVGDIGSALSLVLANIDHHMHEMDLSVARLFARQRNVVTEVDNAEQFLSIPEVAATCSIMQAAIALCQRNTWRMNPGESEALWFRLLDRFVDPLRKLHDARKLLRKKRAPRATGLAITEGNLSGPSEGTYKWKVVMISRRAVDFMQRVLVYLIGEIVNGMMGYVPLSVIMDKLLSNNGKHEFGDFKGTILQMLGLYGYEQTILYTAKHVVEDDMFHNLNIFKRRASRGYAPCSLTCCICKHRLNGSRQRIGPSFKCNEKSSAVYRPSASATGMNSIIIFSCGHAAHSTCIFPDTGMTKSRQEIASCPCCPPKLCLSNLSSGTRMRHKII